MSVARARFLDDIKGLKEAVALDPLAAGSSGTGDSRGVVILRRGMLITSLIALETFMRDRTVEILKRLENWPAAFQDLPLKLREAALLDALPNLQKYARVLKRQDDDYEAELTEQIALMAMTTGPVFGFTKFTVGDYTGNISDASIQDLLSSLQIKNCWNELRLFSSDIGFGVPSVQELVKEIVRKRHRSAHASDYIPTVADIQNLGTNLTCIGLCFDAAVTASSAYALHNWKDWADGSYSWRDQVRIYFVERFGTRIRLKRFGHARALRILESEVDIAGVLPPNPAGQISVIVTRDQTDRPQSWKVTA